MKCVEVVVISAALGKRDVVVVFFLFPPLQNMASTPLYYAAFIVKGLFTYVNNNNPRIVFIFVFLHGGVIKFMRVFQSGFMELIK